MTILRKILLITVLGNLDAFGMDLGDEGNTQRNSKAIHACLASMFAQTGMEVYSIEDSEEKGSSALFYDENSVYRGEKLERLEKSITYEQGKASFKEGGAYIYEKQRQDFLKSLLIKKIEHMSELNDNYGIEVIQETRQQIIGIADLFLQTVKRRDKDVIKQMAHTANLLFFNTPIGLEKLGWAEKCLTYSREIIRDNPSRIEHIDFLKRYDNLDSLTYVSDRAFSLEREFYLDAIGSADILFEQNQQTSKSGASYEIRQVFSKAAAYETSEERKQAYQQKLVTLANLFPNVPYRFAGKQIICTPEEISKMHQLKSRIFTFNENGTILDVQGEEVHEEEVVSTSSKPKKPLTAAQKAKKAARKKEARRKKAQQTQETLEPEEFQTTDEAVEIVGSLSDGKRGDEADSGDKFMTLDEEETDYHDVIEEEKKMSKAKKALKFEQKPSGQKMPAEVETIEVSGQHIWLTKKNYSGLIAEKQKVYQALDQIDALGNRPLKKDQPKAYLARLFLLLGIPGEKSFGHVKILGIDFGYHEVHGSHGNDWTIDMVKRLKHFAVKVRGVFDHIVD